MQHRVWFERAILPDLRDHISGRCEPLGPGDATPDDMYAEIAAAEAVIAGSNLYTGEVMDLAPGLKVISRTGIGFDRVDVPAATARGIAVCNAPRAPTLSTAEHTVMLMLTVAKKVKESERRLREGDTDLYAKHHAIELDEKNLGLIGFGRIARRVAGVAAALGLNIYAYDPFIDKFGEVIGVGSLDRLLAKSDIVSMHVPLNDDTRRMMGKDQFAAMKQGAIFINTARGGLVDHDALLAALEAGHLFGAGLDVTDPEPLPPDHPLLHREDVVVTPHVATATDSGKVKLLTAAFDAAIQVLDGEKPANLVNPEVWK